jgi:hypothetical protein
VVLLSVGVVSHFAPGSGVHARLDASKGTKSAAFEASRQFRYGELSDPQLASLNWAVRRLPGDELQRRYGNHPTIRNVALGEIMRAADEQFAIANSALAKLAMMDPVAVKASENKYKVDLEERKKKLAAMTQYWPVITNVVREPAPWGYFMLVNYNIKLPEGMKLSFLPCALDYGDNFEPKRGKFEFDCLFMPMRNGEYQIRLPDPTGSKLSEVTLDISADYSRATVEKRTEEFAMINEVQSMIPETETVAKAYIKMKSILDSKAYF